MMPDPTAKRFRAQLLGTFRVLGDHDVRSTTAWRSRQNRTILKVLLLRRGHVVAPDELLEVLWPGEDPQVTRPRLHVRISQIRRMLDPSRPQAHVQSLDGGGYRFETHPNWWVDVDVFESLAEAGRQAQETGDIAGAITSYEEARRLYRGDLLEEDRYADWALAQRERLSERHLTLLTELAEAYAQLGRYRRAISLCQRVLARDPFREAVFVHLMRTYAHAGERSQALRTYERCRYLLANEMGVEPMAATRSLAEQIRTGAFPADGEVVTYPRPVYEGRLFQVPYSLAHTPFVGRDREYAWLIARWQEARPGLILVEGEVGVGKTRLVEEALGFAQDQGARVLRAGPLPEAGTTPYAALIKALRPLWRAADPAGLPKAHHRALATLFTSPPPPSRSSDPVQMGTDEGRMRQLDIASILIDWLRLTSPPGTVIYLDDATRLDSGSTVLMVAMARVITVIATARTEELPSNHPLRVAFHDLAQDRRADRLNLMPLPDQAVPELIRQMAGHDLPSLIEATTERADGNPLFLVASLQALFEAGALHVDDAGHWVHTGAEINIAPGIRELIEGRLHRLSREQRAAFDAIAVIGQDFDFPLLRQVVGELDETPLLNTLDELLDLGLVVEPRERARGEFAPAHSLYAEVAQMTLPSVRARQLHGRVADALSALHPDDAAYSPRLAHYLRQAGRLEEAVPHAVAAGELALHRYAVNQAVARYSEAAGWAGEAGWTPDRAIALRLHLGWAEALHRSGQPGDALAHYRLALPNADGAIKLHVIYQVAALQAVSGGGTDAFSREAATLESEISEQWILGALRSSQAYWAALSGEPDTARRLAAEGLWQLRQMQDKDDVPRWVHDRTAIILARTHLLWGEWHQAQRFATRAVAGNIARQDVYGATAARVTLAQAVRGLGQRDEACRLAEEALTEAETAGDLRLQAKALTLLAQTQAAGTHPDRTKTWGVRLLDIAEETGDLEAYASGQMLRARLLLHTGAAGAAVDVLQPLLVRAREVGVPAYIVMILRHLAEAQLAAGDDDCARASIHSGLILARRCRMRHQLTNFTKLEARVDREASPGLGA